MPKRRHLVLLAICSAAAVALVAAAMLVSSGLVPSDSSADRRERPAVTVVVDLRAPIAAKSQIGFLHGLGSTSPQTRWIAPLRPALWRGTPATVNVDRASRFGARFILVLSDLWGYPGVDWYGGRPPWEDYEAWRAFVAERAEEWKGRRIVWDIWNEPDVKYFWNGTAEQYFETYRIAAAEIRSRAGSRARIAGPSTSAFRWSWIEGLLRTCAVARCEVNVLTWHELLDGSAPISAVGRHVRRARSLLGGERATAVGLREVHVNESVGAHDFLSAGEHVAYLAASESSGADGSVLACWSDPCGFDNCMSQTLDGLLDHETGLPRPAWWASKWYARGVAGRVAASSTDTSVSVLASAPGRRRAEVLAGYYDPHDRLVSPAVDIRLRVRGLERIGIRSGSVQVRVDIVRGSGESAATPRGEAPRIVQAHDGTLRVDIGPVALHDALRVRIRATSLESRAAAPIPRSSASRNGPAVASWTASPARRTSSQARTRWLAAAFA